MDESARAAMLRLGALARLARAHILGNVDGLRLAHPEGEPQHQRHRLGAAEVAPKWPVVAFAQHLRAQSTAGGDAEAVRLTLSTAVQQSALTPQHTRNDPPFGA